jgi:hypothetical protein
VYENKENLDKMGEEKAVIFGNLTPILQISPAFDEQIAANSAFTADFCRNVRHRQASYSALPLAGREDHARTPWRGGYPQSGLTSPQLFQLMHRISAIPSYLTVEGGG